MVLSQHRVLSFKTVRLRAPCDARCMGSDVQTWSTVCSGAPHSHFSEGARAHLCMHEWNRPTPIRKWLSLTQTVRLKLLLTSLVLVLDVEARNLGCIFTVLRIPSKICPWEALISSQHCFGTNGRLDLSLSWQASEQLFKRLFRIQPLWNCADNRFAHLAQTGV